MGSSKHSTNTAIGHNVSILFISHPIDAFGILFAATWLHQPFSLWLCLLIPYTFKKNYLAGEAVGLL